MRLFYDARSNIYAVISASGSAGREVEQGQVVWDGGSSLGFCGGWEIAIAS
jgi:xanthine/CO dehydrogenase XdhC/CoxF family maturation factor